MSRFKLGKKPAIRLMKTPALSDFMPRAAEWPAVKQRGWEFAVPASQIGMLGNGPSPDNPPAIGDGLGDCAIACAQHYAQVETANTGNPLTPTTALAIQAYSAITGYVPGSPSTDQGTSYQLQLLPYWKNSGIPMLDNSGKEVVHKILGWASLDLASVAQQRYACDVFGGVLLGINCPESAEEDTSNWLYIPNSPIMGGHAVNVTGQGSSGGHLNSWGLSIPFTWEFVHKFADEAYIVVTPNWLDAQGESPSGFDLNGLLAVMKEL